MTLETERERRANFIIRHADEYMASPAYQRMVDHTVFLTDEQKGKSQLEVDRKYGSMHTEFAALYWMREGFDGA